MVRSGEDEDQFTKMAGGFYGEYNHNIDAKGRLIFPAEYRDSLGEQFFVTVGFDGCLTAYDEATWTEKEEKLKAMSVMNPKIRKLQRTLLSNVQKVSFDKQGRVLIRENLRAHAKLTKDVTLAGVGDRIEIWDTDEWNKMQIDDLDSVAEELGELGISL